jgi:amino acid adenylation domain-containing protein
VIALHQRLALAAEKNPDGPAVIAADTVLTFAGLRDRAAALAARLRSVGVGRGDRVAIVMRKSPDAVAAIHGVLWAGAAYVPIDPSSPPGRAGLVLADAAPAAAVVDRPGASLVTALGPAARPPVVVEAPLEPACLVALDPTDTADEDLAYILFTSGSTGRPKGVALTHRNGAHFVDWAVGALGVGPADRLTSHAPFHFDLSIFDLFASTTVGAPVVLVPRAAAVMPREMAAFVRSTEVTVWYSVPTALRMLVERGGLAPGDVGSLRVIAYAGEAYPPSALREAMTLFGSATFWNLYGPTETNVCTAQRLTGPPVGDAHVPIGAAIEGVTVEVVDDEGRVVAPGTPGELVVAGPTVTAGYWGDPGRSAGAFLTPPGHCAAFYRTGDVVVADEHGVLTFRGRRDHQVKVRGVRVELGEVETALHAHPGVGDVAVVAVGADRPEGATLRAHVTGADLDAREIVSFCRKRLPAHMVPGEVVVHAELPRTPTGKIDRVELTDGDP